MRRAGIYVSTSFCITVPQSPQPEPINGNFFVDFSFLLVINTNMEHYGGWFVVVIADELTE